MGYVDGRKTALGGSDKVMSNERIAVMAAHGDAAEFLSGKSPQGPLSDMSMLEVKQKIEAMHTVLDAALAPQQNPS